MKMPTLTIFYYITPPFFNVLYRVLRPITRPQSGFPNTSIVRILPRSAKNNTTIRRLEFVRQTGIATPLIGEFIDFLCSEISLSIVSIVAFSVHKDRFKSHFLLAATIPRIKGDRIVSDIYSSPFKERHHFLEHSDDTGGFIRGLLIIFRGMIRSPIFSVIPNIFCPFIDWLEKTTNWMCRQYPFHSEKQRYHPH